VVEHFTGRRGAVEELLARVEAHDRGGLVASAYVIDGMPGVGKTAFVIHAAHVLADRYSDGAMFVDLLGFTGLRPLSVTQALDELLAQAGVFRARIPGEDGPKQALWRRVMRERRALIVLDNARDAGQVEPLLPQAAGCLVLVTARSKLYDLDATPLPLAVLTAAEARSLFTAVAGAERCRDGAAVDRIVAGCHRLPLAVRLMAGRVRHGDPIEEVAADVEELSAERKIRGVFDLSYASLDADLQRAVRLLGVYPGVDIAAEVMAALADTSSAGGRRLLRGLAMHNLIDRLTEQTGERTAGSRYRPHDLLRDYARSRAGADELPATRAAALDRLAVHYMAMVAAAVQHHAGAAESSPCTAGLGFDDTAQANAWLVAERASLLAFIDAVPTTPAALPATTGRLLERLCHWPGAAHCYKRALTIAQQNGDRPGQAYALRGLANVDWMFGRYQLAQERCEQALTVYCEIGDRSAEADALWRTAMVDWVFGRYESAQERSEQALIICRETGDRSGQANALRGLAEVDRVFGRYESAQERSEQALIICRETGDRSGEAFALWGLAKVDLRLGRHKSAQERFEQALIICRETGDRAAELDALQGLAEVDLRLGRHKSAQERYEQALSVCRDLGDQFGEAYALWGLGQVAEATADADTAGERWREALQIFEALQIPFAKTVRDTLARRD